MMASPARHRTLDDAEKLACLRLIRTENVGPITFFRLVERFGSAVKAIAALPSLSRGGGRLKDLIACAEDVAMREIESVLKIGGEMVFAGDEFYPLALSAVEDAPPVLTVLGNKRLLNLPALGIVGARNASLNGCKFAEKLAREFGEARQMVVSGLARGIDTAAHTGALATGTIAAVAGGVDIVYPPENAKLYDGIKSEGCIVAESPLGTEPMARHFPKRNRIISGLSSGIVVVEATLNSGSLITARTAAEQGRNVFAVPGHPFDPRAAGPNRLLQDGAGLVLSASDVLEPTAAFRSHRVSLEESPQDIWANDTRDVDVDIVRDIILQNISSMPVAVDELVRNCHVTISAAQEAILELELAGRVQRLPANRIVLVN